MKLLLISHEYPPVGGGGANDCIHLANQFAGRGHEVHVLTVQFAGNAREETSHGGRMKVFRVPAKRAYVEHSTFFEMLDYLAKARQKAYRLCASENYDICLCFFGLPGGVLAHELKRKYGLPYVVRLGGGDIPGGQDRFKVLYKVLSPRLKEIWRCADALVANSEGLRETARDFCSQYEIRVITNAVDTEEFKPVQAEDRDESGDGDGIRLLTVCRLLEGKGIQDVIPHLRRIERETQKRIHWTIAGDGPYRGELEKLAEIYAVTDRITFLGHQTKGALPGIYRRADLFVFPSHHEGMPNTVLEAMASGLPVIMREDCQSADELIRGNGIASADFAADLQKMVAGDKTLLKQMGEKSREIILNHYTWNQITDQYEALLADIKRK